MMTGGHWLGQNADVSRPSPVVEKVKEMVSGPCTIFRRMSDLYQNKRAFAGSPFCFSAWR